MLLSSLIEGRGSSEFQLLDQEHPGQHRSWLCCLSLWEPAEVYSESLKMVSLYSSSVTADRSVFTFWWNWGRGLISGVSRWRVHRNWEKKLGLGKPLKLWDRPVLVPDTYNPSTVGRKLENQKFKVISSYRGNSRLTWAIETLSHKSKEMRINKASLTDGPPRVLDVVKKEMRTLDSASESFNT